VIECLPTNDKVLNSNPSTTIKTQTKQKKTKTKKVLDVAVTNNDCKKKGREKKNKKESKK
jgi:hypothetical protein